MEGYTAPSTSRDVPPAAPPAYTPPSRTPSGSRFPYGLGILTLAVVVGAVAVLIVFSKAEARIVPASSPASLSSAAFTATTASGTLPYLTITSQKTATKAVPSESTETVNDSSQGTVTIMNAQGVSQPLITNTRFQTPSGQIFRIHQAVSVPAGTAANPGKVDVTLYADQGGEAYNIAPSSFTLPGLKGSKAYDLVSAKSVAPFTGGFSGTRPSVADATSQKEYAAMETQLASDVNEDITSKVPSGYVLVPGATFTTYAPQPTAAGDKGTVALGVTATAVAVVLPTDALAHAIAAGSIGRFDQVQGLTLSDVSGLKLTSTSGTAPADGQDFAFTLSGTAEVQAVVDPLKIAGAVAGKDRASAQSILSQLPEVESDTLILRPFWKETFPNDPSKIKVSTTTPASAP